MADDQGKNLFTSELLEVSRIRNDGPDWEFYWELG
jgi:hypothetical protein